jgi:Bacterial Ig domain
MVWFALALLTTCLLTPAVLPAQTLDQYGGYTDLPAPGGGTGFFRLAKFGSRWMFATPEGNGFWLRSVYHANEVFLDSTVIASKYGGDVNKWATNRNNRFLRWGFNTLGEFTSTRGLPVSTWGGSQAANPVKLPFIMIMDVAVGANLAPASYGIPEAIKDIIRGVPTSTYSGGRGVLVDVYDPKFAQAYQNEVAYWSQAITGGFADKPWVVGITLDDADSLFGLKSRAGSSVVAYPHVGFLVATTKFSYSAAENPQGVAYQDPKLYAKYAWIDFLKAKYGSSISALNSAWGTGGFYTSFDDAGGYGSGTGVIDEDGRHTAWMGTMLNPFANTGASPGVQADLDAFLYQFAKYYAQVGVGAIRAADRNHLVFGPTTLNNYGIKARDQVLRGLADGGIDVFCWSYDPRTTDMSENSASYDVTGKPALIWYSVSSQVDSAMSSSPARWALPDFSTQAGRGAHYRDVDLPAFVNARGGNGDYYVLGINWWELVDQPSERTNYGLITTKDNAYDGREAVIARGTDAAGYATGGEAANYGDFLTAATQANTQVHAALLASSPPSASDTTRPTATITGIANGATVSGSVSVTANASDNVGVTKLELLLDGTVVATYTGASGTYTWDTTKASNASHSWVARATDAAGNTGLSTTVTVTVSNSSPPPSPGGDTTPPTATLTGISNGATVSGTAWVTGNASDNVGVTKMDLLLDGAVVRSYTGAPATYTWDTTTASNGPHSWVVRAADAAGNTSQSATVTVTVSNSISPPAPAPDTTPPTATITGIASGATVSGTVSVTANGSDNVGVSKLDLLFDGNPLVSYSSPTGTYTWDTTTASNGSHTWAARATDAAGNTSVSATVAVTVSNQAGQSPAPVSVSITQPTDSSTVRASTNVTIAATTTGSVTKVEFYVNGTRKCTDSSTPYTCNWKVPSGKGRTYTLIAKVYDAAGNVVSSNATTVTSN